MSTGVCALRGTCRQWHASQWRVQGIVETIRLRWPTDTRSRWICFSLAACVQNAARGRFAAFLHDRGAATVPTHVPSQRGFTLLELMVVVVILGILAALVVPKVMSRPDEARVTASRQDVASLMQALQLYRLDNQRYPTTEQGLQALVTRPDSAPIPPNWKPEGYVGRLPKDPWGHPYAYLNPGVHGEIDVYGLGADGAPGGEGNDADIGSWML
jgi:general secretion pathway protein G